jgi:Septum formation
MSTETAGDGRPGAEAGAEPTAGAEPGTGESEAAGTSADDEPAGQQGKLHGDGDGRDGGPGSSGAPEDHGAYADDDYEGDYDGDIAPDAEVSVELIEFAEAVELDEPAGTLRPRHWRTRLFIAIGFLAAAAAVIVGAIVVVGKITHGFKQPVKVTYHVSQLFSLQTGDCFDPDGSSSYTLTSCDSPHEAEVFGTFVLAKGKWPGSTAVAADASSGCATRLTSYLNPQLALSLTSTYAYPDETAWKAGTRTVICEVRAASGQITGSVKGASATIG